jgi:hypothetical protein
LLLTTEADSELIGPLTDSAGVATGKALFPISLGNCSCGRYDCGLDEGPWGVVGLLKCTSSGDTQLPCACGFAKLLTDLGDGNGGM